ncbi:MAG: peptidyl-Asp metallopeptidase, partial [Parcubacteria group bacterium Gr01-1014_70]
GTGFTFENNAIFVKGKIIFSKLSSPDGSSLEFSVTPDIPCLPDGSSCPIKVVTKNGISNAKPVKLAQANFPPDPTEPPTPPPPPPPGPAISGISPSYGRAGTTVDLYGSGFTASGNSINLGGVSSVVSGLASADGNTLTFTMPASPCVVLEPCSVSVVNARGTSNAVAFTVTQNVAQVAVTVPNGGEKYVQGFLNPIGWSGGTDMVHIALVEASAVQGNDPTNLVVGWISISGAPGSNIRWDAKEACDITLTTCFPVAPGEYKILAVSENEFGKVMIGPDGNGNWDLSNAPFSVLAPAAVTVLSPNGGEKVTSGGTHAISWKTTSLLNQSVSIDLWKGGVFFLRLITSVSQSAPDGTFFYNWTVPASLQAGNDYTIEIADPSNPSLKDTSDAPFSIGPQASIVVTAPNGGERWYKGFQATIQWNSGNILSKAVNIDLWKGGTFVRRLAENVPQKLYSWSTQTYVSGTGFNYVMNVPVDISDGSDYTIVVSDFADVTTKDASNGVFTISAIPDPVTFSGRVIDRFSTNPLVNLRLSRWPAGGGSWSFAATTSQTGAFSVITTTSDLTSTSTLKGAVTAWPGSPPVCYMNWMEMLYRKPDNMYVWSHQFDLLPDKVFLLPGANVNLGDVPMWPATGLYFYSDISTMVWPGVSYPDSGYGGYQILALEHDLRVSVYNQATGAYVLSPSIKIPFANGCTPKTLTFIGGVFTWEPYNVRSGFYIPSTLAVGSTINTTPTVVGGVAPYTWELYYGPLPVGLTLNRSTGQVTGVATTPGVYKFQVKITDANGVNGGTWPMTVTVK